jgi:hypothetical protein
MNRCRFAAYFTKALHGLFYFGAMVLLNGGLVKDTWLRVRPHELGLEGIRPSVMSSSEWHEGYTSQSGVKGVYKTLENYPRRTIESYLDKIGVN